MKRVKNKHTDISGNSLKKEEKSIPLPKMQKTKISSAKDFSSKESSEKIRTTESFLRIINNLIQNKFFRFGVFVTLFLFLLLFFYSSIRFDYTARFGFDQWEYQSMGVNLAKGHGINKFGGIENYEEYKFHDYLETDNGSLDKFIKDAGRDNFYRTPGYTVFLGAIYYFAGISPEIAMKTQAILILLIYAFLPIFCFWLFGNGGFVSGIFAALLSAQYGGIPGTSIMTEPLILIFIFILALGWYFEYKRKDILGNLVFGIITGLALLVKGSFIFIPLIVLTIKLFESFKQKERKLLINSLVYLIFTALTIFPWSYYASSKSGKLIILSTQGEVVLLDTHNEYSQGGWAPEWISKPESFYNNDNMKGQAAWKRVLNFYKTFPEKLPILTIQKIIFGFIPFLYLWLIFGLFIVENIRLFIEKFIKNKIIEIVFLIIFGIPFLGTMIYIKQFDYNNFYDKINEHLYSVFLIFALPFILGGIRNLLKLKKTFILEIPGIFVILFVNFFILTASLLGEISSRGNRYVLVSYFIMITFFCYHFLRYVKFLYSRYSKPELTQ